MAGVEKLVMFDVYCSRCEYSGRPEKCDPCNECMDYGGREYSERPINFVAMDGANIDILAPEVRKIEF